MPSVRRVGRILVPLAFALGLTALPVVQVAGCSCAIGEPAASIRDGQLAFIGTVVDRRDLGIQAFAGSLVEYAFAVERASAPTTAITHVSAGESDASCGITFAVGETWLIVVPPPSDMEADTHLCAGNLRLVDMGADQRADLEALLPVIPTTEDEVGLPEVPASLLVIGAALLLLSTAGLVAFRRTAR